MANLISGLHKEVSSIKSLPIHSTCVEQQIPTLQLATTIYQANVFGIWVMKLLCTLKSLGFFKLLILV